MSLIDIGAFDWSTIGMDLDTWEGRMAAKAAARRGINEAAEFLAKKALPPDPSTEPVYGIPIA